VQPARGAAWAEQLTIQVEIPLGIELAPVVVVVWELAAKATAAMTMRNLKIMVGVQRSTQVLPISLDRVTD